MRNIIIAAALLSPLAVFAGPDCTKADKSQWQDPAKFQEKLVQQGIQIGEFKVTDGNCYEIYGKNQAGKKVEVYFDPVSGNAVKGSID